MVDGGGLLLLVGAGALLDGAAEVVGALVVGVAVVVTGAAWVVAGAAACVVAALWAFFLWCTFFLWCIFFLWCVVVVLVVSAARCCLALCVVVDEPPQPAMATARATVNTSARFIAPLRSLEDVDSGWAMLAQMLRRSVGSLRRPSKGCHLQKDRTTACRQKRQHDYHLAGVARGRLRRPQSKPVDLHLHQLKGMGYAA